MLLPLYPLMSLHRFGEGMGMFYSILLLPLKGKSRYSTLPDFVPHNPLIHLAHLDLKPYCIHYTLSRRCSLTILISLKKIHIHCGSQVSPPRNTPKKSPPFWTVIPN